jgi:hypothetical protein
VAPFLVIAHPIKFNWVKGKDQLGLRSEIDDSLTELFAGDAQAGT